LESNYYGTRQAHPYANIFPLLPEEELKALADDIAAHGLREPIWVHRDGRIIDGRNRYRACELAGIEPEYRAYQGDDGPELLDFVISLNLHRRHLNESQRAMVADSIANLRLGANQHQSEGTKIFVPSRDETAADLFGEAPAQIAGVSQAEAAELLNVSDRSVQFARKVREQGVPELVEKVIAGTVSVSAGAAIAEADEDEQREVVALDDEKAIIRRANEIKRRKKEQRQQEKAAKVAEISAREPDPLDSLGPFPIIYADPPWRYDYAEDTTRQIENHYPTMSLDEIKALDLPAADDAVLFLWATSPKLVEALEVMAAWGFEYRTCMVWVKDKIGMGYYARQQHELLLIGKRGALPVPDPEDRPPSVIEGTRGAHSAKPDRGYELIERMYPLAEKCELFQRRPRNRWSGWGNQAEAAS
jgi:N6-adenosine-specific RNA methylase IME4/ParB-like chromosome segregation protein Spo0J